MGGDGGEIIISSVVGTFIYRSILAVGVGYLMNLSEKGIDCPRNQVNYKCVG